MDFKGGEGSQRDRGVNSVVAIILLFAMVGISIALAFTAGSAMIDALESGASHERAQLYVDETDHRLLTVASTGQEQELPIDEIPEGQVNIVDDGEIEVVWYGGDNDASASGTLGALEFELEDRTIAHQGGGIWEDTDNGVRIESEPRIGYDGDSLQLTILQIDESAVERTDDPIAWADYDEASKLTERINDAARDSDGENVSLRITSSYHEGWYRYLDDEIGGHENVTVEYDGDETVVTNIRGVRSLEPVTFAVDEDRGLVDASGDPIDPPVIDGSENFRIGGVIENVGDETATQEVTVSIWDDDPDDEIKTVSTTVTLDPNETENIGRTAGGTFVQFEPGQFKNELTAGETYRYTISTEDDETDEPGSFYFGKKNPEFEITSVETVDEGENTTITASVRNVGLEEAERDVTIEFDEFEVSDTKTLTLDYGATGTVEWTVNRRALPLGDNDFTIAVGDAPDAPDDTATDSVEGIANGDGEAYVVVRDKGIADGGTGKDQVVEDDGTNFSIRADVANTYATSRSEPVTVTIPDADVELTETPTISSGDTETVEFDIDPAEHDFEHGTVYEYNVTADGDGLSERGSFYFGKSGTAYELSNQNASVGDEYVTLTADLHNVGVEDGDTPVTLDLDYQDELPERLEENPYEEQIHVSDVSRSFGENATIELPINQSNLIDGPYEARLATNDDSVEIPFTVTAGVDPGRVGLGEIEDANVTVEIVGSQVSGNREDGHQLAPMTLDIVTNGETKHSFENPSGGDNINTGPTWQDKSKDSYTYSFTIEEETDLTLRNTRYRSERWGQGWNRIRTCADKRTDPNNLPNYSGPTHADLLWCSTVPDDIAFGPIDASQNQNLQNVRVRSAENNAIPALPAGTNQQLSATEVLERRGLVEEGSDELELGPGEFVFLFENTESTEENGIDALWNDAITAYENNPDQTYDPNFNDLIVYVEVERAGVDPGKPSITIRPGAGDSADIGSGEGSNPERVDPVNPDIDSGSVNEGDAPELGTGKSDTNDDSDQIGDTGVNIDNDYIVVG